MHIGVVIEKYPLPPTKGGAIQTLVSFYLDENELTKRHKFDVYCCFDEQAKSVSKQYRYTKFHYIDTNKIAFKIKKIIYYIYNHFLKLKRGNGYANAVGKEMKNQKFDIVIVEGNPKLIYGMNKVTAGKFILHLHNDYLNCDNKNSVELVEKYDAIFTISDFLKQRIKTICPTYKNIFTLNNGIELKRFRKNNISIRKRIRKKYNIEDQNIVFLYSGRMVPEKGCLELVKAFASSRILSEKAVLLLAGGVTYGETGQSEYFSQIKQISELNSNIILTGYIDYSEISDLYIAADVGVVPTICEEAFGLCVVENMASGNPVIATNSGALPYIIGKDMGIIVNRDNDLVESLKDSMNVLAIESETRENMAKKAFYESNKYDKSEYCKKFNELLNTVYK